MNDLISIGNSVYVKDTNTGLFTHNFYTDNLIFDVQQANNSIVSLNESVNFGTKKMRFSAPFSECTVNGTPVNINLLIQLCSGSLPAGVATVYCYDAPVFDQYITYADFDEGYHHQNGTVSYNPSANAVIQKLDDDSVWKIKYDWEGYGHHHRWISPDTLAYCDASSHDPLSTVNNSVYYASDGLSTMTKTDFRNESNLRIFDRLTGCEWFSQRITTATHEQVQDPDNVLSPNNTGNTRHISGVTNWFAPTLSMCVDVYDWAGIAAMTDARSPVWNLSGQFKTCTNYHGNQSSYDFHTNGQIIANRPHSTASFCTVVRFNPLA